MTVHKRLAGACEDIGRRRARRGVPIEVLTRAVRLDFRIIWSAIRDRLPSAEMEALADCTVHISDVVEEHSARIYLAYLEEVALRARAYEDEQARLFDSLLSTEGRDSHVVTQVAAALGIDGDGWFLVAAAPVTKARRLMHTATALKSQALAAHLHHVERDVVLIVQLPNCNTCVSDRWLADVPCAVAPPTRGLACLPATVKVATELAQTLSADSAGPMRAMDCWTAVTARQLPGLCEALQREVLPDRRSTTASERDRLLETVTAFLCRGSVAEVAAELFCHRNTVQNRLRRFTKLTGIDLARPVESAPLLLALTATESGAVPQP